MAKKPCGTWKVTDIPEDKVSSVAAGYKLHTPKPKVTKEKQADGKWTVTAVFEDCPPSEPNSKEKSFSGGSSPSQAKPTAGGAASESPAKGEKESDDNAEAEPKQKDED